MKYGFVVPGGTDYRGIVGLAKVAEESGWDGIFVPDCIYIDSSLDPDAPGFDPWVILAGMAVVTERIKLGTMLTPPSRRRPWKLARETATLDRLSNGRLILPVGLGAIDDGGFGKVGEATGKKERAELLDESLAVLEGLWSGKPFSFEGKHYRVGEMTFLPPPVQKPRIPVWVVGMWPREKSMQRALRWDGLLPNKAAEPDGTFAEITPDDIRQMREYVHKRRENPDEFDIIHEGETPGDQPERAAEIVRPYAEAGATWWMEALWGSPHKADVGFLADRLRQGPPAL